MNTRKEYADENKGIFVQIPDRLHQDVKLLLLDPLTNRVKYGAMRRLIARLLAEWVERQRRARRIEGVGVSSAAVEAAENVLRRSTAINFSKLEDDLLEEALNEAFKIEGNAA